MSSFELAKCASSTRFRPSFRPKGTIIMYPLRWPKKIEYIDIRDIHISNMPKSEYSILNESEDYSNFDSAELLML